MGENPNSPDPVAALAFLLENFDSLIAILDHVVMDTEEERAQHANVIAMFRQMSAAVHAGDPMPSRAEDLAAEMRAAAETGNDEHTRAVLRYWAGRVEALPGCGWGSANATRWVLVRPDDDGLHDDLDTARRMQSAMAEDCEDGYLLYEVREVTG